MEQLPELSWPPEGPNWQSDTCWQMKGGLNNRMNRERLNRWLNEYMVEWKHVKEKSNKWGDRLRDYMSCASVSQQTQTMLQMVFSPPDCLLSCYNLSTTASLYSYRQVWRKCQWFLHSVALVVVFFIRETCWTVRSGISCGVRAVTSPQCLHL